MKFIPNPTRPAIFRSKNVVNDNDKLLAQRNLLAQILFQIVEEQSPHMSGRTYALKVLEGIGFIEHDPTFRPMASSLPQHDGGTEG